MYTRIIGSIFLLVLLTSCGWSSPETLSGEMSTSTGAKKTEFIIKTQKLSDLSNTVKVEKAGRITASSNLTLTSQWAGEIGKILIKEGQRVKAGSTIAILKDTVNNFDLRLDQAENNVTQQNASITSTEVNLTQWVDAARIGYSRAKLAYENTIGRKNIQYDALTNGNMKVLEAHNINYKNYLSDLERQLTQMLYSGDKILGITTNFEYANDPWESYLGARVWDSRSLAINEWNRTYTLRSDIRTKIAKNTYITPGSSVKDLAIVSDGYDQVRKFADAMIYMIQNNVVGAGLGPELQAWWVAEWNGIRAQIQGSDTGFGAWKSQVLTFLKTYEWTEQATNLALASLTRKLTPTEEAILAGSTDMRVTYETTRLDLRDRIDNANLSLEQAKNSYDSAVKIRDATLTQLRAVRENAIIGLAQARRDYAKLSISAPVEWIVTRLLVGVGQSIGMGSPIAEFSGKKPEIVVDIDPAIAREIGTGDAVTIDIGWIPAIGTITAISTVAWANLLSTVRITVIDGEKYIGRSVNVTFNTVGKINKNKVLVPIDAIKIISEWEWEISLLTSGKKIDKRIVKVENVGGSNVEISGEFSSGDVIITNDLSNYDPLKNTITIQ
jgi:multidrug resistance efflux pump